MPRRPEDDPWQQLRQRLFPGLYGQQNGSPPPSDPGPEQPQAPDTTYDVAPYGTVPTNPTVPDIAEALQGDVDLSNQQQTEDFENRSAALGELGAFIEQSGLDINELIAAFREQGLNRADTATQTARQDVAQGGTSAIGRLGEAQQMVGEGVRQGDELLAGADALIAGHAGQALGFGEQSITGLNEAQRRVAAATDGFQSVLRQQRGQLNEMTDQAWAVGREAMMAWTSQVGNMQTEYNTTQMQTLRANKEQRSAELAQAGYSPMEIEQELKKMDLQAGQEAVRQNATFKVQEETNRRSLQLAYDQIGVNTSIQANQMGTTLAGIEGTFTAAGLEMDRQLETSKAFVRQWMGDTSFQSSVQRANIAGSRANLAQWGADRSAALESAKADVDRWVADSNRTIEFAGVDAAMRAMSDSTQYSLAGNQLQLQGYESFASLWQNNSQSFTPVSSAVMSLFGLWKSLEDANYGIDGAGLSLVSGAATNAQAATQGIFANSQT